MTKEELQKRIDKKQIEIQKTEKRIDKWTQGMSEEAKNLAASMELVYDDPTFKDVFKKFDEYRKANKNNPLVYRQDYEWNKGPNIDEAYNAYRDLAEAKATLNKYVEKMKNMVEFTEEEKIKVIWDFLLGWKSRVKEFVYYNTEKLGKLNREYQDAYAEWVKEMEQTAEEKSYDAGYRKHLISSRKFKEGYYNEIIPLTREVAIGYSQPRVDEQKLEKILNADLEKKYKNLKRQVEEKAGEILDASNLYIDNKGNIAGTIKGSKNTVNLWTTLSGGYNVQMLHFRSYCNIAN